MTWITKALIGAALTVAGSASAETILTPPGTAGHYFGRIQAPCRPDKTCAAFITLLEKVSQSCGDADKGCPQGEKLLRQLFGDIYRPWLADYVIYFDRTKDSFLLHPPRLLYQNKNTPHLYGVRDVYILLFSQKKACVDATVTTEFKSEPNPFTAVFTALGTTLQGKEPKEAQAHEPVSFHWYPLSGDPSASGLWLGFGRAKVEQNSVGRVTVTLKQPKAADSATVAKTTVEKKTTHKKTLDSNGNTLEENSTTETVTHQKPKPPAEDDCSASDATRYSSDFIAASAFFSNSPASRAGFSLALGATLNAGGTSLSSGGSDEAFNGYALAKWYWKRPELRAHAGQGGYRPSWAMFVGTGVKSSFDELVIGGSWGHLVGNVGLLAGANYIKAAANSDEGRKWRGFVGLDYSF